MNSKSVLIRVPSCSFVDKYFSSAHPGLSDVSREIVPHSGQRAGLARKSYPHTRQRPVRFARRLRVHRINHSSGDSSNGRGTSHIRTATVHVCSRPAPKIGVLKYSVEKPFSKLRDRYLRSL